MADVSTTGDGADQDWGVDMLYGSEPSAAPPTEHVTGADGMDLADIPEAPATGEADNAGGDDPDDSDPQPVDLDADDTAPVQPDTAAATPDVNAAATPDVNAGAKKTAVLLGAGVVVAVAAIVAALVTFSQDSPQPSAHRVPSPAPAAAAEPVPSTAPPPVQDQAIPYTASADCPPGSTSAQALTDTASDSAWVCVRGGPGSAVDGQVLNIDLGRTYQVVAVEVTPGWVAKTPGGKDEWLQHRVVTRLQYIFFNGNEVADIFTQDTGNAHGPVNSPLRQKVLASRVKVIVLQTFRPPASPLPTGDPTVAGTQPGFVESVLGEAGAPLSPEITQTPDPYADLGSRDSGSDPVDYTFAMSSLKFIGYLPN